MFDFKILLQDSETGKTYKLAPEIPRAEREAYSDDCTGCAFRDDARRCLATPSVCMDHDQIYVEA
jgi:hypothetical protein